MISDTKCDELSFPISIVPNDRLVVDTVIPVALTPVPVRATELGDPWALSLIVRVAFIGPRAVGVKCPWKVQLAPAASVDPQLF